MTTATPGPEPATTFETPNDLDAINKLYRERGWSDGLPIVPQLWRAWRTCCSTRHVDAVRSWRA